jgi:hypothetical protein
MIGIPTAALAFALAIVAVLAWIGLTAARTLIGQEVRGWIPYAARWLIRGGLRHLPPRDAARYREECEADLLALSDRPLTMLWHAVQMRRTARQLATTVECEEGAAEQANVFDDVLIEELDLGLRSYNCLKRAGIQTVGDLISKSRSELAVVPNFSEKSIDEVIETLHTRGLGLLIEKRA